MIGEIKFDVVTEGVHYRLSDGTNLVFLSPMNSDGVTNEELIGVLLHRLRVQGKNKPAKTTSRAITILESLEECLWRRAVEKQQQKEELSHAV
jgi:Fe-S cluster assembly ATPase SufC